jgi:hypothetical protein
MDVTFPLVTAYAFLPSGHLKFSWSSGPRLPETQVPAPVPATAGIVSKL